MSRRQAIQPRYQGPRYPHLADPMKPERRDGPRPSELWYGYVPEPPWYRRVRDAIVKMFARDKADARE